MASKGGHAATSDGTDSQYREKVDNKYKEMAKTKTSLKWYILFTVLYNIVIIAHILLKKYKKMYWLTTRATPAPFNWEMALVGTLIPAMAGWKAIPKNNIKLMKVYVWGTLVTGLIPLAWGAYSHYDDLMKHINGVGYRRTILGWPRAIVIYGFLLCTMECLTVGANRGRKLIELWSKKERKEERKEEKKAEKKAE